MVRVLGNSLERVEIKDLNDVIYYKQLKDYTDQEHENSKDLKREIQRGRLVKIEEAKASRGSADIQAHHQSTKNSASLNIRDLKVALREVLPEFKNNGGVSEEALKGAIREIAPIMVDMIRQEISKIAIAPGTKTVSSKFKGPEYIPDISTDGMISNVEAEKKEVSADKVQDNLAALRRLKQK